jgi:outer membrane protein assembly factor BamB
MEGRIEMTQRIPVMRAVLVATLWSVVAAAHAADSTVSVPIGHQDFYPSPERPIGFRGDGSGNFEGATPPIEWWDGTPIQREIGLLGEYGEPGGGKPTKMWDHADAKPKNILWKAPVAGWGYSTPTVVGNPSAGSGQGRVYVLGNPYWVTCYDIDTGKEIWKKAMTPFVAQGMDAAKAEALRKAYDLAHAIYVLSTGYDHSGANFLICAPKAYEKKDPAGFVKGRIASCDKALAVIAKYRGDVEATGDPKLVAGLEADIAAITSIKTKMTSASPEEAIKAIGARIDIKVRNLFAAMADYKVGWGGSWYGYCGNADATLLSDGKRVYGTFAQGQTFAYDLDGNLVWARQDYPLDPQKAWHRPVQLIDGVLISRAPHQAPEFTGDDHVSSWRGYDPATGKILWEVPWGGLYCYGLPVVARLQAPDGKTVGVFITPNSQGEKGQAVIRVTDGKVLGTLPKQPIGRGPHFSLHGDLLVSGGGGDGRAADPWAVKLRMTGPETVEGDQVWSGYKPAGFRPSDLFPVWKGSWRIQGDNESGIRDLVAGKTVGPLPGFIESTTLIGDYLVGRTGWRGQAKAMEGRNRADKKAMDCYGVVDLRDPSSPRTLSDRNLIGYTDLPADHIVHTYLADWDLYDFANCYHGFPSYLGADMAGVTAHGERLFINTVAYLYCIGPAVKGTSKDDPKVVAAIRAAKSADEVAKYLESDSAQYRYEAVKKVAALGKAQEASGKLETLAKTDAYEEIRAEAFRALGLEAGKPGAKALVEHIATLDIGNPHNPNAIGTGDVVMTLRALGKDAEPTLVALLGDADLKQRVRATMLVQALGPGGEALRDALIAFMADDKAAQAVVQPARALSAWPADAKVTEAFAGSINNAQQGLKQGSAFAYLYRTMTEEKKNVFLGEVAAKSPDQATWSRAVEELVERKAFDVLGPVIRASTGPRQGGLFWPLCHAAKTPEAKAFTVEQMRLKLEAKSNPDELNINALPALGAEAGPLLPLLKALNSTNPHIVGAIADIERKVAEAEKK